jgi:hypothetical protein
VLTQVPALRIAALRTQEEVDTQPGLWLGEDCSVKILVWRRSVLVFWSRSVLLRQHAAVEVAAAVGREDDGLRFEEVERSPEGEIRSVGVRLRVPGLDASLRVSAHYATGFDELVAFLSGLASDWRGWPGERTYESLEHDLRLTATHDGHVQLVVQLWEPFARNGWSATAVVQLDPGEEMTGAAGDVAALLSPPGR